MTITILDLFLGLDLLYLIFFRYLVTISHCNFTKMSTANSERAKTIHKVTRAVLSCLHQIARLFQCCLVKVYIAASELVCAGCGRERGGISGDSVRFQRLTSGSWQEYSNGMGLFVKRVEGDDLVIRWEKCGPKGQCVIT